MRIHRFAAAVGAAIIVAGCSVTTKDYKSMTATELAQEPEYMPSFRTPPPNGTLIGEMTASVCQATAAEPPATHRRAEIELKRNVALAGGRAIVDLRTREDKPPLGACITSSQAFGTAYDMPMNQ